MPAWLLPEYIEDILPNEARRIEELRRKLLDLYRGHGFELVMPPLLEYLESLLTGTGHDLDLRTFKLVDQLSGRLLGLRADITPQVARIDAHLLNRAGVVRLCYCGSVVHTLPSGFNRTREPLQIGAELYGHAGIESDVEVQQLLLDSLRLAGVEKVQLDLGHVAVFRSLVERAGIGAEHEAELFRALQSKDLPALRELVRALDPATRTALGALPELYGGAEALTEARRALPDYPEIRTALDQLDAIAAELREGDATCCFDLAELRGYHYHSGVVFAAYTGGWADAVALGGRYDEVGEAFGRARPATGFSLDLRELCALAPGAVPPAPIAAPHGRDPDLQRLVDELRARGEVVAVQLPGHENAAGRRIVRRDGRWQVLSGEPGAAGICDADEG